MSLIESLFELKTKKSENKTEIIEAYRVLVNFWNCIKIHVPNVLSCVTQVFPHYTKHDISHSYAILDSIERILGKEAIEKLSVTDLWLLLCSAYYHDIGMYISGKEIEKCLKSEEFKKYVFDLKDDTRSPLNKYAGFYVSEKDKLNYDKCELTLDSYNSARFLLAAFFRDSHADRSENYLQSDTSVTEMFSEIKRLITVIAEICRLHCAKFEEVMKFSEVENGVNGIEDYCHPRFVACMLRMGDLLDFDSSRVSKPSLDHLSSSIPSDSEIHNKKNYCITHALITPEKVDVYAECKEVEVAFEIDKWFTMIREEMSNQRNAWHDIASSTGIKGFPMCGKLETKLSDYEKIDNKLKARFEIEGDKAIKILQGSGIYKNKFQCIRELLQNAIDATYLRIYLEKLEKKSKFTSQSIEGFDEFLEICKQPEFQIEVRCKKNEIDEKNENKKEKNRYSWHFEIQDHGIGIRREDLKFLLKIGSGKNNKEKFDIINKMPEYAKPSGIFGIGFQSIFLITDEVNIKSRYALCDEVINMKIGTPLKDGFALLKTEKNPFADKGTTISFDVNDISVVDDPDIEYSSYYECFNKSYDFIKNQTCDIEVAEVLNAVNEVGKNSYLNIICRQNDVESKEIEKDEKINKEIYQDKESNLIVEISSNNEREMLFEHYDGDVDVFFRNEVVSQHNLYNYIKFLRININILSGSSDEILSVSRNTLKPEYVKKISNPLKRIIIQWLNQYWEKFDDEYKKTAAMFLEYYGEEGKYEEKKEWWKKIKIEDIVLGKTKINYDSVVIKKQTFGIRNNEKNKKIDSNCKIIKDSCYESTSQFLAHILKKYYKYGMHFRNSVVKIGKRSFFIPEIEFKKEVGNSVKWVDWLKIYRRERYRSFMPCFDYDKLQINDGLIPEHDSDPMNLFEKSLYPRTVCPYIVKDEKLVWECSDDMVQWVYENRSDKDVTIDEIKQEFEKMKKAFSEYVDADGKIIDKSKEPQKQKEKNAKLSALTKSKELEDVDAELRTAPKSKKQGPKKTSSNKKKSGKAKSKK